MIAAALKKGAAWDFNGHAGELEVRQHYEVVAEEDIQVPAGKFHAFRMHGEQTSPSRMTIDRWFASGIGVVKDETLTRAETGALLYRISLELMVMRKLMARTDEISVDKPK